jgi:hypothetical protein
MPMYTFLHNLLNVLVQIANKMGLQKEKKHYFLNDELNFIQRNPFLNNLSDYLIESAVLPFS